MLLAWYIKQPFCNFRYDQRSLIKINNFRTLREQLEYTGLFISPSGISELDCATTKTDTAERSISIGRESLQVFLVKKNGVHSE